MVDRIRKDKWPDAAGRKRGEGKAGRGEDETMEVEGVCHRVMGGNQSFHT